MPKSENKINTSAITSETIMYSALQQPPPLCGDGNLADNYRYWKRTFDWYLIASGRENTSDREKCALFLHVIGPVGRDIYEELDVATEEELSYTSLCDKFSKRCDPQKNVNFERHVFFETVQNKESFEKLLALLKIRSKTCEFDKLRESLILTQLIRGVRDVQLRERMLRKSDLKLEEAASWCRAAEIAGQQANTLQSTASGTNVSPVTNNSLVPVEIERVNASLRNRVPSTEPRRVQRARWSGNVSRGPRGTYHVDSRNCKYCNFNHERNKCPAYNVKCFRCYKMGHFAKCCKAVLEIELSSDSDNTEIVNFIEINSISKGWFQKININNVDIRFKLDSGADVCVMSKSSFQEAGFNLSTLHHSGNILREMFHDDCHVLCPYTEEDKQSLRRELGLTETIIQDSIESIVEWFDKQPHLTAAGSIDRRVVERLLLIAKGSIEKTKKRIDGYYKFRMLAPEIIQGREALLDSDKELWTFFTHSLMPKLYHGKRITVVTFRDPDPNAFLPELMLKTSLMLCDLRLRYDYAISDIWVMDFKNVCFGHVLRLPPLTCKKAALIFHEGVGMGMKGVHVINCTLASKLQILLNFVGRFASTKILERVMVHEQLQDIYNYIPKEYLPRDIGGNQPSCEEFRLQYEKEIRNPNTKQLLVEMSQMVSEETLRPGGAFHEDFLDGSFRQLEFD